MFLQIRHHESDLLQGKHKSPRAWSRKGLKNEPKGRSKGRYVRGNVGERDARRVSPGTTWGWSSSGVIHELEPRVYVPAGRGHRQEEEPPLKTQDEVQDAEQVLDELLEYIDLSSNEINELGNLRRDSSVRVLHGLDLGKNVVQKLTRPRDDVLEDRHLNPVRRRTPKSKAGDELDREEDVLATGDVIEGGDVGIVRVRIVVAAGVQLGDGRHELKEIRRPCNLQRLGLDGATRKGALHDLLELLDRAAPLVEKG